MKCRFTRLLTLATVLLLVVAGYAQKNVLNESFTSSSIPQGWAQTGSVWAFSDGYAVFKTDQDKSDTLVTKMVNVSELAAERQVTIFYKLLPYQGTTIVDKFTVLYRTSDSDSWKAFETITGVATDWTQKEFSINTITGDLQIAFAANPQYAGGIQLKQVKVESASVCGDLTPQLNVPSNITAASADLSWSIPDGVDDSEFSGYQIKISDSELATPSVETSLIDAKISKSSYKAEGLLPGITYFVYVRAICGDEGDGSPWANTSFKTLCEIPAGELISEDFEEDVLSDCYTVVGSGVSVSDAFAYNGSKSVLMSNTKNNYSYIYLPQIKGQLSSYQLSFYMATDESLSSKAATVAIIASNAADAVDATVGETFSLPQQRRWEKITYSLKGLEGKGSYIAIKAGSTELANKVYIDNVSLEPASSCLTPMFVQIEGLADKSAQISWKEGGSATSWNLLVSPFEWTAAQLANEDLVAESDYLYEATVNPFTATNLTPNTRYYVYVTSACDKFMWSEVQSFKTAKEITFPFTERFDRFDATLYTNTSAAIPLGWVVGVRDASDAESSPNTGKTDAYVAMSTDEDAGGSNYVAASLYMKGTSVKSAYAIMPAMPASAPALNECMIEFYVHSTMSDGKIVVGVCDEQTWNVPTGKMFMDADANFKAVDTISLTDEVKTGWQYVAVNLKNYTGSGKYLALRTLPAASTFMPYIDNISLKLAPSCFNIQALKASATNVDAINVTWTEAGKSTSWLMKVSTTPMEDMTATADVFDGVQTSTDVDITGLTANTIYYVYVRANCEESEWQSTSVLTMYAMTIPYYNDFDLSQSIKGSTGALGSYGSGSYPQYWLVGNLGANGTNASYIPYTYNTKWSAATGYTIPTDVVNPSLMISADATVAKGATVFTTSSDRSKPYAIMPMLQNADVKDVILSFYGWSDLAIASGNYVRRPELKIGVLSDPTDLSTLTEVTTISLPAVVTKEIEYFTIPMSSYAGSGKYIVFYENMDPSEVDASAAIKYRQSKFYIDNLFIGTAASAFPVTNVVATPTADGAVLSWKENGSATKWNIKVYDSSILGPTVEGAVPVKEVTATSNPFTLTGLDMSKMYYVYIQSVVGAQTGAWGAASFKTICGDITLPWFESFNYLGSTTLYNTTEKMLTPCISYANGLKAPTTPTASGSSFGSTCPDHVMGQDPTVAAAKYDSKTDPNHYVVQMYASSTATAKTVQIDLPQMPAKLNTLQLTFYLAPYSTYHCGVRVGVQTDTEFIPVQNILGEAGRWTECIVSFGSLADDVDGRIAIRADYDFFKNEPGYGFTTSYTGGFIDDILVEKIPQCAKITSISVSELDSVSGTISWEKASAEAKWNVKVSSTQMTDMSATADIFDESVDVNSIKVTGLEQLTDYFVYIQASRPDEDCVGEWSNAEKFKTLAKAKPLPYFNDFEGEPEGSITNSEGQIIYLPEGMSSVGDEGGKIFMAMNTGGGTLMTPYSGKYVLDLQASVGKANYLVLPLLKTDDIKKLQLEFYAQTGRFTSYDYTFFDVGVMTDPTLPSTYSSVLPNSRDSVMRRYITVIPTDDGWVKYIYTFENYVPEIEGQIGKYIAIRPMESHNQTSGALANGKIFIDNILIKVRDEEELIEPFALWVTDRTRVEDKDDVTFVWHAKELSGVNFRVKMFEGKPESPDNAAALNSIVTGVNTAVLSGAKPNMVYYAYVRAEKGDKTSAWSQPLVFRTTVESAPVKQLPYAEDFEIPYYAPKNNATTTTVASCGWNIVKTSGNLSTTASYQKDGSKNALLLGANAQLMTPQLEVEDWRTVTISMDVMASTTYDAVFQVRLAETADAAGVTGSESVKTIDLVKSSGWTKVLLPLSNLSSVREFKYVYITCDRQVAVDNVSIVEGEALFAPENLNVEDFGDTWVAYSFDEFTKGVGEWIVEYGPEGFALGSGTQKVINAKLDTITGLTPSASYDIYIKSSAVGKWSLPLNVALATKGAMAPYHTNFSDAEDNALWHNLNTAGADRHNVHFIIGNASECGGTGEKALFLSDDDEHYHYHTTETAAFSNWTAHTVNIPSAGTYMFYLRMKAYGVKDYKEDCVSITFSPASATYSGTNAVTSIDKVSLGTSADNPEKNHYVIVPRYSFLNESEWQDVYVKKDILQPGTYQLLVNWNTYSVNNGPKEMPIAIDTISIEEFECTEAQNVKITDIDAHSASFSWFGGQTKDFEVAITTYKNLSNPFDIDAQDYVAHETISNGPSYSVSGLAANTEYMLYVRSICSNGPTEEYLSFTFRTVCDSYGVPFTEEFYETPDCWTLSSGVKANVHKVETDEMKLAGTSDIYNYLSIPKNGYAVLPLLNEPINNLDIKVDAWNVASTASYPISVGVVETPTDISTYENLFTYDMRNVNSTTGTYLHIDSEEFEFYTNKYSGAGKYLVIRGNANAEVGVRSIKIVALPPCVPPTQVEINQVKENSVVVNWQTGSETAWKLYLNDGSQERVIEVTEQPYTLTGLESGTSYSVQVQAICGGEDVSTKSVAVSFSTKCGVYELPLSEDFSDLPPLTYARYNCWENKVLNIPIENVFAGASIYSSNYDISAANQTETRYPTYTWHKADYWRNWMDNSEQLVVWDNGGEYNKVYGKWLITPQYYINDDAVLTFDLTYLAHPITPNSENYTPTQATNSKLYVLVSTDNAQTWKQEDANLIDLSNYGIEPSKVTIDMKAYKDKAIRVALYYENRYTNLNPNQYIFIDNLSISTGKVVEYNETICAGKSYNDHGFSIDAAELVIGQTNTFERIQMGDVITLNLTVEPIAVLPATVVEKCEGEVYENNGYKYETDFDFVENVYDEDGCLVRRSTQLRFKESTTNVVTGKVDSEQLPFEYDEYLTIPAGASGLYEEKILTGAGCVWNQYQITIRQTQTQNIVDNVCENAESYTDNGFNIASSDFAAVGASAEFKREEDKDGYTAIYVLTLNTLPIAHGDTVAYICPNGSFDWHGQICNDINATYTHVYEAANGCDSIVSLTLKEYETYNLQQSVFLCFGTSFVVPQTGEEISTAGEHVRNFSSINGCDSIMTYIITIGNKTVAEETMTLCEGSQLDWNDVHIESVKPSDSGDYEFNTKSVKNAECDSTITLHLVVNPATEGLLVLDVCQGAEYEVNGETKIASEAGYFESEFVTTNHFGCDSLVKVQLTVRPSYNEEITDEICLGQEYTFNNVTKTYNKSGVQTEVAYLTAKEGCDSIVTLKLNVLEISKYTITKTMTVDELPYTDSEFGLFEIPAGSPADTYTYTGFAEDEPCTEVTYNITVNDVSTSYENAVGGELSVYPSVLRSGEQLTVSYNFTVDQLSGMKAYIYDFTGKLVDTVVPTTAEFKVEAPQVQGMYTLHIITGTNEQFTAKFVVK